MDRVGLDAAILLGLPHGGWCPKGRIAEDGTIPEHYELTETDSSDYRERTVKNIVESDATLVLTVGEESGGTKFTIKEAFQRRKPCLIVNVYQYHGIWTKHIVTGLHAVSGSVLNVAGPRWSKLSRRCADEKTVTVKLPMLLANAFRELT